MGPAVRVLQGHGILRDGRKEAAGGAAPAAWEEEEGEGEDRRGGVGGGGGIGGDGGGFGGGLLKKKRKRTLMGDLNRHAAVVLEGRQVGKHLSAACSCPLVSKMRARLCVCAWVSGEGEEGCASVPVCECWIRTHTVGLMTTGRLK